MENVILKIKKMIVTMMVVIVAINHWLVTMNVIKSIYLKLVELMMEEIVVLKKL